MCALSLALHCVCCIWWNALHCAIQRSAIYCSAVCTVSALSDHGCQTFVQCTYLCSAQCVAFGAICFAVSEALQGPLSRQYYLTMVVYIGGAVLCLRYYSGPGAVSRHQYLTMVVYIGRPEAPMCSGPVLSVSCLSLIHI